MSDINVSVEEATAAVLGERPLIKFDSIPVWISGDEYKVKEAAHAAEVEALRAEFEQRRTHYDSTIVGHLERTRSEQRKTSEILALVRNGLGGWLDDGVIDVDNLGVSWVETLISKYGMNGFTSTGRFTVTIPERKYTVEVEGDLGVDWREFTDDLRGAVEDAMGIDEPSVGEQFEITCWDEDTFGDVEVEFEGSD